MTLWLHLETHGFHVPLAETPRFAAWLARRPGSLRSRIGTFRHPSIDMHPPRPLARLSRPLADVSMIASAVRTPRDNSRLQIFDLKSNRILHAATFRPEIVADEIATRAALPPDLAPPILHTFPQAGAWVEPLLAPIREPTAADALHVLAALAKAFAPPTPTPFAAWRDAMTERAKPDAIATRVLTVVETALASRALPCTTVHGDINPGNLYPLADSRVLVGDWEYTRVAIATYDLWIAARYWPSLDFAALADVRLHTSAPIETTILDLAHRLEWYLFLLGLPADRATGLRARLRRELAEHPLLALPTPKA